MIGISVDSFSDIDECLSNPCDANADCKNTIGSFTCKCRNGFNGDGLTCTGMLFGIIYQSLLSMRIWY